VGRHGERVAELRSRPPPDRLLLEARSGQVNSSSEDRVPGTARPDRGLDTAHLVPAEASRAGAQVLPRICRSASSDRTSVLGLERVDDRFVKFAWPSARAAARCSSSSSGAEERDVLRACEDLMTSEKGLVSFVGRM
jgi:hypothetical protein